MHPQLRTQKQQPYTQTQTFSYNSRPHSSYHPTKYWLKKSLFNPPAYLQQSYVFRNQIQVQAVPKIEVLHLSKDWMLLQTPKLSRNFFKRLNSDHYNDPYQELLKIFVSFIRLTRFYGFFKLTANMIYTKAFEVKVWIDQDLFSNCPMIKLDQGVSGQREFVSSFISIIEAQMMNWQEKTYNFTINDTIELLECKSKVYRQTKTVTANKSLCYEPIQPLQSMLSRKLDSIKKMTLRPPQQKAQSDTDSVQQPVMNTLATIYAVQNEQNKERVFQEISNLTALRQNKHSSSKLCQFTGQIAKTKNSFNLSSTSSTLRHFSQKCRRSTMGKKTHLEGTKFESTNNETSVCSSTQVLSSVMSIQNELQGLFAQDDRQTVFGAQGNYEQLERIAEQMEEVLIW